MISPIVQFEVTEEDIKNGKPRNCILCPIALALERKLAELGALEFLCPKPINENVRLNVSDNGEILVGGYTPLISAFVMIFELEEKGKVFIHEFDIAERRKSVIPTTLIAKLKWWSQPSRGFNY